MYQALLNATKSSLKVPRASTPNFYMSRYVYYKCLKRRSNGALDGALKVVLVERHRLKAMKLRLSSNYREGKAPPPAFFEVDLQLDGVGVRLDPSVEEIQAAINGGAVAVLKCSKMIEAWDTVTIPKNVQLILDANLPPVQGTGSQGHQARNGT